MGNTESIPDKLDFKVFPISSHCFHHQPSQHSPLLLISITIRGLFIWLGGVSGQGNWFTRSTLHWTIHDHVTTQAPHRTVGVETKGGVPYTKVFQQHPDASSLMRFLFSLYFWISFSLNSTGCVYNEIDDLVVPFSDWLPSEADWRLGESDMLNKVYFY